MFCRQFNFAFQDILKEHEEHIESLYRIMVNLRNLILFATLRTYTSLRKILMIKTQ